MAKLTIVQYAGDFRETVRRFDAGGPETYRSQRYSVGQLARLAGELDEVAIICGVSDTAYDERLSNGVRAIGLGHQTVVPPAAFLPMMERLAPTHVALMTPITEVLRWSTRRGLDTIAILADSFSGTDLRARWRHWRLARALNAPGVAWVGNHALNSCLSLLRIGVRPDKIVPWDWPPASNPHVVESRLRGDAPLTLLYVGAVVEAKGVGDLIDAVALLRDAGEAASLTIVGTDDGGAMAAKAAVLNLEGRVRFAGRVGNVEVSRLMTAADVVVVPSRHGYAEGLPMVIYEALSVRTPLIASDHPMFRGAIVDGQSALIFPAGDPCALAATIRRLDRDPELYAALSRHAAAAWHALQLPVLWGDLLRRWMSGRPEDREWIAGHCIASGIYDAALAERRAALGIPSA